MLTPPPPAPVWPESLDGEDVADFKVRCAAELAEYKSKADAWFEWHRTFVDELVAIGVPLPIGVAGSTKSGAT